MEDAAYALRNPSPFSLHPLTPPEAIYQGGSPLRCEEGYSTTPLIAKASINAVSGALCIDPREIRSTPSEWFETPDFRANPRSNPSELFND